jgi:hypothetical protein
MSLARLRRSSLAEQLPLALTIENLKNLIVYYLVVNYAFKCWRRIVTHGPVQTVVDGWRWLSLVRGLPVSTFSALHFFGHSESSSSRCGGRPPEQR